MSRYAESTYVPVERSQQEIVKNLRRYGADAWAFGEEGGFGIVRFRYHARPIQFRLKLPDRRADEFRYTPARKYTRNPAEQLKAWEQACRQLWRALNLFILSTLEAVESGIVDKNEAFIANTLLQNQETVGERFSQEIQQALETGRMPRLLLPGPSERVGHKEEA